MFPFFTYSHNILWPTKKSSKKREMKMEEKKELTFATPKDKSKRI